MNTRFILFILLCFTLGMTSCSLDDELMTDNKQTIQATNTTDPTPEHEGEDEELEPNN